MNEKLQEALIVFAGKIGTTTEYAYGLAVRQVTIDAWIVISAITIFTIVFGTMFAVFKYKYDIKETHDEFLEGCTWICGCAMFILVFAGIPCVLQSVAKLLNPEYAAIEMLLRLVK